MDFWGINKGVKYGDIKNKIGGILLFLANYFNPL
jgi:hypothetical protein